MAKHSGIMAWFASNPVAANLLMLFIIVGGLFSAFTINKEIFPTLELNMIHVIVPYPSGSPEEIETSILIKIEEEIKDINGIEEVTSTARENLGTVYIQVADGYDPQNILDKVKLEIDAITSLPDGAESVNIYLIEIERSVLWLSLYGNLDRKQLKAMAKDVRDEIRGLPGVTRVKIEGMPLDEIAIEVTEDKLREYSLTFEQVAMAVKQNSVNIATGSIKSVEGNILLRTKGQASSGAEFENIVVMTRPDGSRVLLKDVANINDGFEERIDYTSFNRQPAMIIAVASTDGQNSLKIAETIKQYVAEKKQLLPSGVSLDIWGDLTFYLKGRLNMMLKNMYTGCFLVFLVLAIFLNLKLAFWVIIGLPICFLGALFLMPLEPLGLSINVLTLFAFILVLGIVVDDAIIIGESAYSEIEKSGLSIDSIIRGAKRVVVPATFGVLTTIAAFSPMMFISGSSSIIWKSIAAVVMLCLIFSLIESKWILPAHLIHSKQSKPLPWLRGIAAKKENFNLVFKNFIENDYRHFLNRCLNAKYTVLAVFIGLIIISFGLIAGGKVRWAFFPNLPQDIVEVRLDMKDNSAERNTFDAIQKIEEALYAIDDEILAEQGYNVVLHSFVAMTSKTSATMVIELTKGETREVDGFEILDRWRAKIPELPNIKKFVIRRSMNQTSPIAFKVISNNNKQLAQITDKIKAKLSTYNNVYDVSDNYSSGSKEIQLKLLPEGEMLGISLSSLAQQVRHGFYGYEAQRILRNKEEVKVIVRYPLEERQSIGYLENMRILTPEGVAIPLSAIAELNLQETYSVITRVNNLRAITIEASADKNKVDPSSIAKEVFDEFIPIIQQEYPDVKLSLAGDSEEEGETIVSLMQGAVLAMVLIYGLIAIPLRSYSQPILIMSVIPFGFIGAIFGHLIQGLSLNILSMMGIIALSGVVVNDSLIMVYCVNEARQNGMDVRQAAIDAGCFRFRAIVLTSMTTFFGILPILFESSLQAKVVIPMATSLSFGILFATLVTLILIPSLYLIAEDIKDILKKIFLKNKTDA
ncbi:MAG: efflux RND transporter permease subunit [Shewanellaceae bacterium]|nr:efflux RND transporter permease subunit [Shewanellaceae bacterium]